MIFNSPLILFLGCFSAVIAQTAVNCGIKGYDRGKNPAYLVNSTVLTASGCKNLCAASTVQKCASFAIGTSACLLYNVTVAVNVNNVNTSSYTFYDAACPVS
jgi:hypothetical protein